MWLFIPILNVPFHVLTLKGPSLHAATNPAVWLSLSTAALSWDTTLAGPKKHELSKGIISATPIEAVKLSLWSKRLPADPQSFKKQNQKKPQVHSHIRMPWQVHRVGKLNESVQDPPAGRCQLPLFGSHNATFIASRWMFHDPEHRKYILSMKIGVTFRHKDSTFKSTKTFKDL